MGSIIASSRFGKQYTQQPITITITIMIRIGIGIEKSHDPRRGEMRPLWRVDCGAANWICGPDSRPHHPGHA